MSCIHLVDTLQWSAAALRLASDSPLLVEEDCEFNNALVINLFDVNSAMRFQICLDIYHVLTRTSSSSNFSYWHHGVVRDSAFETFSTVDSPQSGWTVDTCFNCLPVHATAFHGFSQGMERSKANKQSKSVFNTRRTSRSRNFLFTFSDNRISILAFVSSHWLLGGSKMSPIDLVNPMQQQLTQNA